MYDQFWIQLRTLSKNLTESRNLKRQSSSDALESQPLYPPIL